jgi:hypothetical protein
LLHGAKSAELCHNRTFAIAKELQKFFVALAAALVAAANNAGLDRN